LISTQTALAELIDRIADIHQIAIDTEADSLHSYFEKICLIQIGIPDENLLVDPLADLDLQPLFDAIAPKRLILHGADYDLRLLNRSLRFQAEDLFDTMIASRLCGFEQLGLAALVERFFEVKLSKASQKANWALRPLSPQMVEYALNDTRYLLDLGRILEEKLHELGRWEWFRESIARMAAAAREIKVRDDETAWRIAGSAALPPRALSVLRILWQWRDAEAKAWDRPPFHVLGNADLLRIAEKASSGQAFSTPRMSGRRKKSFDVVLALALQIPESEWPGPRRGKRSRPGKGVLARLAGLRAARDRVARELALDASIIAPRTAMEATAENPDGDALMNWQRALLGLPPAKSAVAEEIPGLFSSV
jgi:ribonuclease D